MKRRLEIARGLLHYPKVLFLDEPTIGLDPQTRNHIWNYVQELKKHEDITIFLTTHYMDEAENCDRIAIVDYGKIIASTRPRSSRAWSGATWSRSRRLTTPRLRGSSRRSGRWSIAGPDGLCFEVEKGAEFVPGFIRDFGVRPSTPSWFIAPPWTTCS